MLFDPQTQIGICAQGPRYHFIHKSGGSAAAGPIVRESGMGPGPRHACLRGCWQTHERAAIILSTTRACRRGVSALRLMSRQCRAYRLYWQCGKCPRLPTKPCNYTGQRQRELQFGKQAKTKEYTIIQICNININSKEEYSSFSSNVSSRLLGSFARSRPQRKILSSPFPSAQRPGTPSRRHMSFCTWVGVAAVPLEETALY